MSVADVVVADMVCGRYGTDPKISAVVEVVVFLVTPPKHSGAYV